MQYPSLFYINELRFRIFYLIVHFALSLVIFFIYFDTILLFQAYPLLSITHRNFISISVTELFTTILGVGTQFCFLIFFLSIVNQTYEFFSVSWSKHQLKFYYVSLFSMWLFFFFLYLSFHFIIVPKILEFFMLWEKENNYFLLQIKIESRIKSYFFWVISINFSLITMFLFLCFTVFIIFLLFSPFIIFTFLRIYKYHLLFSFFTIFSFFISFDFLSQILLLALLLIFFDTLLLLFSLFSVYLAFYSCSSW